MTTPTNPILIPITSGNCYLVKGYRDSAGTLSDLCCRHTGRQGYLRLTRESLEQLDTAHVKTLAENLGYDPQLVHAAYSALKASLEARLDEDKERPPYASRESFTPLREDVAFKDNDPTQVVVTRVEVLHEIKREVPEAKPKKASAAHFRSLIEEKLPIHRYRHRLNLYPGKFETVLPDASDQS
jgi:hypothetical protein